MVSARSTRRWQCFETRPVRGGPVSVRSTTEIAIARPVRSRLAPTCVPGGHRLGPHCSDSPDYCAAKTQTTTIGFQAATWAATKDVTEMNNCSVYYEGHVAIFSKNLPWSLQATNQGFPLTLRRISDSVRTCCGPC